MTSSARLSPSLAAQAWAVIVAGGSGTRMGVSTPKQFISLHGRPILAHTIEKFAAAGVQNIVLVLPGSSIENWAQLCLEYNLKVPHIQVAGGASRTASVVAGLNVVPDAGLVAVHDGVRPLVSTQLIVNAYEAAAAHGSAIPVVSVKDSIRYRDASGSHAVDRSTLTAVQTPQTFSIAALKKAYATLSSTDVSDDATVLEAAGHAVHLIEGDYRNIKITTAEDLIVATALLHA